MRVKRNRVRRRPPADQQRKPFFEKQSPEAHTPFFDGKKGIQPKFTIGQANDPLEKEADAAARQVMSQQVQKADKKEEDKAVQKAEKKEEEKAVQKAEKKEEDKAVQKAEKKEEEKAVQKAEKKEEEKPVQKAEKKEEEKAVQKAEKKEEEMPVQKAEKEEEKPRAKIEIQRMGDQKEEEPVQAKIDPDIQPATEQENKQESDAARPNLETMLKQQKGKGAALPDDVRKEMEQKFRADFSQVRIHTDQEAVNMCNTINAQAFAHGYDLYFNEGKYNPNSSSGKELLAHELAHVVQQKG